MYWLGYRLYDSGIKFQQRQRIFFSKTPRLALGHKESPIQWVPGPISKGIKQLGRETDTLPPVSPNVRSGWSYTSTLPACLSRMHSGNFTFLCYLHHNSLVHGCFWWCFPSKILYIYVSCFSILIHWACSLNCETVHLYLGRSRFKPQP